MTKNNFMPKISIVIPTFNCAQYISEAIDSVLNQSFQNFEIILVDDGSTDNTKKIIEKYIVKYREKIQYFYQKNSGASAARNKGIFKAKGEYIAFLDADDIWLPDKLKLQVDLLDSNPDSPMVYTDAVIFNNMLFNGTTWRPKHLPPCGSFRWKILQHLSNDGAVIKAHIFEDLLLGDIIPAPTVMIRKSVFQQVKVFDESLPLSEDYDLFTRISEKFPIIYLNKITTRCRYRKDSLSGELETREAKNLEHDARLFEKFLKEYPNNDQIIYKRVWFLYKAASWAYLNILKLNKSRKLAIKSLTYNILQPKLYLYILLTFFPKSVVNFVKRTKRFLLSNLKLINKLHFQ